MATGKKRIVVVDDEIRMGESLAILLEDRGFAVYCFTKGDQAIRFIGRERCDLVLLDLIMTPKDGFAVMAEIREIDPEIPILIMTAQGSADTAIKALKGGGRQLSLQTF